MWLAIIWSVTEANKTNDVLLEKTYGERLHWAAQNQVCGSYLLWCPNTMQLQVPFSGTLHTSSGMIFWALGSRQEMFMQRLSVSNVYFFQVFYDNHYLYIFAPDNDCRQKWVRALKEGNCLKQHGHNDQLFGCLVTVQAICFLFLQR